MKRICLDLHDFAVDFPRLSVLKELREIFPKFKVSLFTVPVVDRMDWGPTTVRGDSLAAIKECLDWMEIIPHGLVHKGSEFKDCDQRIFKDVVIPSITEAFKDILPFEEGFCAPHWRWTQGVVDALDEVGWWGAIDRDKEMPCPKRFYQYNYLLNEPFWESEEDVLKLHGHVYGTKNDLVRCFQNLLRLPVDTEWVFASELLEERV